MGYLQSLVHWLRNALTRRPSPERSLAAAPAYSLGRLTFSVIALLVATGAILTVPYQPDAMTAASSIQEVQAGATLGGLIRSAHGWAAFALIPLSLAHAARAWWQKAFRGDRRKSWWSGTILLLLITALAGNGYLLRWDIKAYALYTLMLGTITKAGAVGRAMATWIIPSAPEATISLSRGYLLHTLIIPILMLVFLGGHLALVVRNGLARRRPLTQMENQQRGKGEAVRHLAPPAAVLLLIVLAALVVPLDPGTSDPGLRSPWPQPDWLLALFAAPTAVSVWLGIPELSLVLPISAFIAMIVIPLFDRPGAPMWVPLGMLVVFAVLLLTILGQTVSSGAAFPLQGCDVCHNPSIEGGAPILAREVTPEDPAWLLFHMQEPVSSILSPRETR